jgi:hypothetical protein
LARRAADRRRRGAGGGGLTDTREFRLRP